MSIREGFAGYYGLCGLKGVGAICSYRLLGIPRTITVRSMNLRTAVHLRVRTSDVSVYKGVILGGEYDVTLPFNPATIVDAGANCGMATLFFATKYPRARIVAIEPDPSNYSALVRNTSTYLNVVTIQAALWNRNCDLALASSSRFDKSAFRVSDTGTKVNGMTIRSLMQATGIHAIDLLKMDIEGAEAELFDNPDWLPYVKAMAIEFHEHLRPRCKAKADAICSDFRSWQRGETIFYIRR